MEPVAAKLANGPTVADLAARYMSQHVKECCKPKTQETLCSLLGLHVLPAFGKIPLAAMNRERVVAFHEGLAEKPTTANMAVRMLSHMFVLAESWGMVADGFNPCRGVPKYPVRRRERFLTDAEFERLGRTLDEAEAGGIASAPAIAALRLLMLTGCRKREILTLKWEYIDLKGCEIRLPDSKTGPRSVALGPDAVRMLEAIPRRADDRWVLAGKRAGTRLRTLEGAWARLRARADLSDVRIHDLRHSYASRALALGESLPMIARLLGHREIETTARYAHLDRASVHEAAARIAGRIAEDIL